MNQRRCKDVVVVIRTTARILVGCLPIAQLFRTCWLEALSGGIGVCTSADARQVRSERVKDNVSLVAYQAITQKNWQYDITTTYSEEQPAAIWACKGQMFKHGGMIGGDTTKGRHTNASMRQCESRVRLIIDKKVGDALKHWFWILLCQSVICEKVQPPCAVGFTRHWSISFW
jgi:hypothetical protein